MSNQDFSFWQNSDVEVTSEDRGKELEPQPKPFSEVEESTIPDRLTKTWIKSQLPASFWKNLNKNVKCTAEMIWVMAEHARKTPSKRAIMARAGLHEQTWYRWERQAAAGEQPYALWYQCMIHSLSSLEEELLDNVRGAALSDWKAATWMLSRLNREEYGDQKATTGTTNIHMEGDSGTKVTINNLSHEDTRQIGEIFQQIGAFSNQGVLEAEVVSEEEDE